MDSGAPEDMEQPKHGTPGEVLKRLFMDPLGLTAYRISKEMSVPPITVSEILRAKRAISATMACKLGVYFGVDPQFWLGLQSLHDLQEALRNGATNGVERTDALHGRALLVREVAAPDAGPGARRWQVLLANQQTPPARNGQMPLPPHPEVPTVKAKATAAAKSKPTNGAGKNGSKNGRNVKAPVGARTKALAVG